MVVSMRLPYETEDPTISTPATTTLTRISFPFTSILQQHSFGVTTERTLGVP